MLIGPTGADKTIVAKRLPTVIPRHTLALALETTNIHLVSGKIDGHTAFTTKRPFRTHHHTIYDDAVVGGGEFTTHFFGQNHPIFLQNLA